ncbi:MAG: hypothetical protein PHG23_00380 [Candidatus Pacebacteria bacterium]|nr:hypothetical protein [Candidatus Paceibacterota bacterium]
MPLLLIILRKILFALSVGLSFYVLMLFSKPVLEMLFKRKFNDDGYFWRGVVIAVVLAIIAGFIV